MRAASIFGRRWTAASIAAVAFLATSADAPGCGLSIVDVTSAQWTGRGRGYQVYDPTRLAQVVNFSVETHDGGCAYFITVSPASAPGGSSGALRGPGTTLRYDVYKDGAASQPLRPANVAGPSEVYSVAVPSGASTVPFQFAYVIWPEQVVPAGSYADEIEIAAYEGPLGNGILRDRRRIAASAMVPQVAEISFTEGVGFDPNYNTYTVNFNSLRKGGRRFIRMKARSNGGYRILLNSQNGGLLKNIDPSDPSTVPYSLTVDGGQIALPSTGNVQAILNTALTPASGQEHRLEVEIGDTTGASAGDYRDVINISVLTLR